VVLWGRDLQREALEEGLEGPADEGEGLNGGLRGAVKGLDRFAVVPMLLLKPSAKDPIRPKAPCNLTDSGGRPIDCFQLRSTALIARRILQKHNTRQQPQAIKLAR